MASRGPKATNNLATTLPTQEFEQAKNGDWIPPLQDLKQLGPDEKRFFVTEAAGYLYLDKPLPLSLAQFVADLVLADVDRAPMREAAKQLERGELPNSERAHWIADWLLKTPRFRGRPRTERPRDLLVGATFYLQRKPKPRSLKDDRATLDAVAKLFECSLDYVQKCRRKYAPMSSYKRDDLIHLLSKTEPLIIAATKRYRRSDALSFLRRILSKGPLLASEVEHRAKAAGHSKRTIVRAKRDLGVSAVRSGRHWAWQLPPSVPNH